jgi:hypothetical protein
MAIEARKVDPPALAEGKARGLNQSKGPLSDRPERFPPPTVVPMGCLPVSIHSPQALRPALRPAKPDNEGFPVGQRVGDPERLCCPGNPGAEPFPKASEAVGQQIKATEGPQ